MLWHQLMVRDIDQQERLFKVLEVKLQPHSFDDLRVSDRTSFAAITLRAALVIFSLHTMMPRLIFFSSKMLMNCRMVFTPTFGSVA